MIEKEIYLAQDGAWHDADGVVANLQREGNVKVLTQNHPHLPKYEETEKTPPQLNQ